MILSELNENESGLISNINGGNKVSIRLMTMGFISGQPVKILQKNEKNALVKVGKTRIALSSYLLNYIEIQ